MEKLQVRVVAEAADRFVWMIVDHVWDSISAPIALAPTAYPTHGEALAAGVDALGRIDSSPGRDHPLQD